MATKMICKYISYNEATRSQTAIRNGFNNTPNETEMSYMKIIGSKVFDPLREHFGYPIKVESFFRCKELNTVVGGSTYSQHRKGQAIDIDDDFGYTSNSEIFYWIANNLEFDQLIWEFGDGLNPNWVHVSYNENHNRNKLTISYKNDYKHTKYEHYYELKEFNDRLISLYGVIAPQIKNENN